MCGGKGTYWSKSIASNFWPKGAAMVAVARNKMERMKKCMMNDGEWRQHGRLKSWADGMLWRRFSVDCPFLVGIQGVLYTSAALTSLQSYSIIDVKSTADFRNRTKGTPRCVNTHFANH
jgi:hypothetical protein